MGLATPTAIMVATGLAAKYGCLVKDSVVWEKTRKLTHAVLDKTGTLTKGKLTVVSVALFESATKLPAIAELRLSKDSSSPWHWLERTGDGANDFEVLAKLGWLLTVVESSSEHPLAQGLLDWAKRAGSGPRQDAAHFMNVPGQGISCEVERVGTVRVGSLQFLGVHGEPALSWAKRQQEDGCVVVALEAAGSVLALFSLKDDLQESAYAAVAALKARGMTVWMLTGDQEVTAHSIARHAGIAPEHVRANCRPETKAKFVQELSQHEEVLMVGDGLNDAAALASASVGVAIGAGSQITADSAQVIIVRPSLEDLIVFLDLAATTMRTIYRNFVWALAFNLIGIPLAAGVGAPWGIWPPPMACGFAMASSSLIVVTSSLSLRLFRRPVL